MRAIIFNKELLTFFGILGNVFLKLFFLFGLQSCLALKPTLCGVVWHFFTIFMELIHKLRDTTNFTLPNVIWIAITRWNVSEGRARREEGEKVGRELVRHVFNVSATPVW